MDAMEYARNTANDIDAHNMYAKIVGEERRIKADKEKMVQLMQPVLKDSLWIMAVPEGDEEFGAILSDMQCAALHIDAIKERFKMLDLLAFKAIGIAEFHVEPSASSIAQAAMYLSNRVCTAETSAKQNHEMVVARDLPAEDSFRQWQELRTRSSDWAKAMEKKVNELRKLAEEARKIVNML
jgi:hypothetical protein